MGLFKDNIMNPEHNFLLRLGFKFGVRSGPRGEFGFTKTIEHDNEYLWITIDTRTKKLYLYNEYSCGGHLWDRTVSIPKDILYDKNKFIDWLDNEIG